MFHYTAFREKIKSKRKNTFLFCLFFSEKVTKKFCLQQILLLCAGKRERKVSKKTPAVAAGDGKIHFSFRNGIP